MAKGYFWRTVSQQEIDYVEEEAYHLKAFEIKWNPKSKVKIPKTFIKTYDTNIRVINKDNFRAFLES